MIKTVSTVYCDRCMKDITKDYIGEVEMLIPLNLEGEEDINPGAYTFCRECIIEFSRFMRSENTKEGASNG